MERIDVNEALDFSYQMLDSNYYDASFRTYSPGYFFTTEGIRDYLSKINFEKDQALTVLSSGDQIFNLALEGVKSIDAFDINRLQYFTFWLKYAMIMSLSYYDFKKANLNRFYLASPGFFELMLEQIKSYLPEDVYEYYRKLAEYQQTTFPYLSYLYRGKIEYDSYDNAYASLEEAYLLTRKNLKETEIQLHFGDMKHISQEFSSNYDVILLSNVLEYEMREGHETEDFKNLLLPYYPKLKENGILVNYFCFTEIDRISWDKLVVDDAFLGSLHHTRHGESYYLVRKRKVNYNGY